MNWKEAQRKAFMYLLERAQNTMVGVTWNFAGILHLARKNIQRAWEQFRKTVPLHTYEDMEENWWKRMREEDLSDVTWKGKPEVYALSSGTSSGATKYIPVSREMRKLIQRVNRRIFWTVLRRYPLLTRLWNSQVLVLGGRPPFVRNSFPTADISGVMAMDVPWWFEWKIVPPREVRQQHEWSTRVEYIVRHAGKWNVGVLIGLPQWALRVAEAILDSTGASSLHQIWKSFSLLVYGGVSFSPYQKRWEEITDRPLYTLETYLASEGYIAYQDRPHARALRLVVDEPIFFEWIPLRKPWIDPGTGKILTSWEAWTLEELEEMGELTDGNRFVLVMSTCSGSWRYILGDVVEFRWVDTRIPGVRWAGRLRFFLNVCGEHLSLPNMDAAVRLTEAELQIPVSEFTVVPLREGRRFVHQWFLGIQESGAVKQVPPASVWRDTLDRYLRQKNADYSDIRDADLLEIRVHPLPVETFYAWLKTQGKEGGQHKFPAVLRGDPARKWLDFLQESSGIHVSGKVLD